MEKVMKKMIVASIICAFLTVPVLAEYTVNPEGGTYGYGIWQAGGGGEFTLVAGGGLETIVLPYYADEAKNQGEIRNSFQSFCLELDEGLGKSTHDAYFNSAAVWGGEEDGEGYDPISVGTAYLYHQFATGVLDGYDYDNDDSGRKASAGELQNAIWYLEDEGGSLSDNYVALLTNIFGEDEEGWKVDNKGEFPVAVLNLFQHGDYRQDVLVLVPLPATILLGLMGLGIGGFKMRKSL
jgi:hypothetical protein